ncbi:MAG: metallophosphoesterase, partial [Clostridia bacterium]|nr:metallophosphoesterase [Clostridia bacterium]
MFNLEKTIGKDFTILNFTDIQLTDSDWWSNNFTCKTATNTVNELVARIKPDLITVSGDFSYRGQVLAYEKFTELFDSFGIPWSIVWGNHDQEDDPSCLNDTEKILKKSKYLLYERGDEDLGFGNFVINITEGDKIVEAIFMVDTHEEEFVFEGEKRVRFGWARWSEGQKEWYRRNVEELRAAGCNESVIISHIPIYAYKQAYEAAYYSGAWGHVQNVSVSESYSGNCWKEGYKDSFGVKYEGFGCPKTDDGVLDMLTELGHTKNYIAGHDHINNYSIVYKGVRLTYALKTGAGCYWDRGLNGGTVITVGENG